MFQVSYTGIDDVNFGCFFSFVILRLTSLKCFNLKRCILFSFVNPPFTNSNGILRPIYLQVHQGVVMLYPLILVGYFKPLSCKIL